jgi:hypothetical protein
VYVKQFLKAWVSDWLTLMSGAPTVPLALLALYVSSKPYRLLYGTLALFCAAFTSYRIWFKERLALEAERAKNRLPRIEAKFTRLQIMPRLNTIPIEAARNPNLIYAADYDVLAEVYLTNLSEIACTVQRYEASALLDGHGLDITQVESLRDYELFFDRANGGGRREALASLLTALEGVALNKGIGYRGWLRFELLGARNTEIERVEFRLVLVDSFDGRHPVVRKELEGPGRIGPRVGPAIRFL